MDIHLAKIIAKIQSKCAFSLVEIESMDFYFYFCFLFSFSIPNLCIPNDICLIWIQYPEKFFNQTRIPQIEKV